LFRTTTTLRSFDIPKVKGEGSVGTVESAEIVPRKRFERDSKESGIENGANFVKSSSYIFVVLVATRFL
jgi:hypothetical protein